MNENEKLKSAYNYGRDSGYADGFVDGYKAGVKDVEPKKGKWVQTNPPERSDNIVCDQCGYDSIAKFIYCPNCGAKMEGLDE